MKKPLILALACCLSAPVAYAAPFGVSEDGIDALSQDTAWHRLLLWHHGKSDARHHDFFLSDNDKTDINPKDELVAVLTSWQNNEKMACRFPARLHFLKERLAIRHHLPDCPEFDAWYQSINADKLSVVFADEHPSNLASGFGHTLMRVDRFAGEPIAINYTPNYPKKENPALGAYRSLAGHYVGVMEILPFAQKEQDYLVKDERDLWQFELDLSQSEIDQIVRHIWEVKDVVRPYYLTHDNCATEIVRLIDVVRPKLSLSDELGAITTPINITQVIDKAGLINHTQHLPSMATIRQATINGSQSTYTKGNPIKAIPLHRLGVSYQTNDGNSKTGLSYRAAYRDTLDSSMGIREFLDLEILGVDVSYDNDVQLDKLTVIRQRSYKPKNTAKGYDGKAGGLELSLLRPKKDSSLTLQTAMERGVSWAIGRGEGGLLPDTVCYGFGMGAVTVGDIDKGYRIGVAANVGCIKEFSDNFRAKTELSLPYWYSVGRAGEIGEFAPKATVGVQYDLNRQNALRLSWQKDKHHVETKLTYQLYF